MPQNKRSATAGTAAPQCVAVTRFSALGDLAMTVPVIYSACACHQSTRFVVVTKEAVVPMFVNAPANLTVTGIDPSQYTGLTGARRLLDRLAALYGIDAIADLQGGPSTIWLRLVARCRGIRVRRIDNGIAHKRELTRSTNKRMLPLVSQRARYREVFYRLGLPVETTFTGLFGNGKGDPALFAEATPPRRHGDRWIGIAPFANFRGKIYPPELMHEVVKELSVLTGVKIFLFGAGDGEKAILDSWAAELPGVVSLAGKSYGFPAELALMSHLDVMVSMDSANMHLASLVDIPVVSIWGATHPYCGFNGWRQQESSTVQLAMTCRPCSVFGDKPCQRGDYYCLSGIKPAAVVARIMDVTDGKR